MPQPPVNLVMSGNINYETTLAVFEAFHGEFGENFARFIFLDSEDTLDDPVCGKGEIEKRRNLDVRRLFPSASIQSVAVSLEEAPRVIPEIFADLLKIVKPENILVDLTNGHRPITNILYAVCQLACIDNLFQLLKPTVPGEKSTIERLESLEDFGDLTRSKHFEFIPYRKLFHQALGKIDFSSGSNKFLDRNFRTMVERAVQLFYVEHSRAAIQQIGIVAEELKKEIGLHLAERNVGSSSQQNPDGEIAPSPSDPDPYLKQIRSYGKKFPQSPFTRIAHILEVIRVHRNVCSHAWELEIGESEGILVFDQFLWLLDLVDQAKVFPDGS